MIILLILILLLIIAPCCLIYALPRPPYCTMQDAYTCEQEDEDEDDAFFYAYTHHENPYDGSFFW